MKKTTLAALALAAALSSLGAASLSGPEILRKVDEAANAPGDQQMEATLILIDRAGGSKERTIQMMQKGADRRFARFLSPADQKGISVLTLPGGEIYVYLPAFKKVKRIASSVKNTSFAGTDFSYEDMEAKRYSDAYSAKLLREEAGNYVLELAPLNPQANDYAKLLVTVARESFLPVTIEYYDRNGDVKKRLTSAGIEKIDGFWTARERTMEDVASGHRTRMVMKNVRFNTGLADDVFTTRNLER